MHNIPRHIELSLEIFKAQTCGRYSVIVACKVLPEKEYSNALRRPIVWLLGGVVHGRRNECVIVPVHTCKELTIESILEPYFERNVN